MRGWPCCLPYSPNRMSVNGGTRNEYQGRCLSVVGSFWFCLLFVTFHLVCIILLLSCRCSHFIRHAMWPYNTHDTCRTNPQVGMSRYGYLAVCKVDGLHRGRDKHVEYMSSLQSKVNRLYSAGILIVGYSSLHRVTNIHTQHRVKGSLM